MEKFFCLTSVGVGEAPSHFLLHLSLVVPHHSLHQGQGVLRDELSGRQRERPGATLSAQHSHGAAHLKDTVGLGLLFQLY